MDFFKTLRVLLLSELLLRRFVAGRNIGRKALKPHKSEGKTSSPETVDAKFDRDALVK